MNKTEWKRRLKKITNSKEFARAKLVYNVTVLKEDVREAADARGMSVSWARKWIKRYQERGLELGDLPRSGRPASVPGDTIRKVITGRQTWTSQGLVDAIFAKTRVMYTRRYAIYLLHNYNYELVSTRPRVSGATYEKRQKSRRQVTDHRRKSSKARRSEYVLSTPS